MEDDQRSCGGEFHTNDKGKVPPLVTTKFLTRDMGNAGKLLFLCFNEWIVA
jgi:protein transport protein SEC24